ncbi:MAG: hypothetical protein ACREEW_11435 [Caulobacteraceae bacterium]
MKPWRLIPLVAGLLAAGGAFAAEPLGFGGAQLGTSLSAWRAMAPPTSAGEGARPVCSDDAGVQRAASNPLSAAAAKSGEVVCGYGAIYGDDVLLRSLPLDASYRAQSVRYLFEGGRLTQIEFTASTDAYDDVVKLLTSRYGAPSSTLRDQMRSPLGKLARVRQTWRADGGEVELVDPAAGFGDLAVRYVGAAPAAAPVHAGSAS